MDLDLNITIQKLFKNNNRAELEMPYYHKRLIQVSPKYDTIMYRSLPMSYKVESIFKPTKKCLNIFDQPSPRERFNYLFIMTKEKYCHMKRRIKNTHSEMQGKHQRNMSKS